jgi:RNA polymerase sigma-70 factor (ECF subfamily)
MAASSDDIERVYHERYGGFRRAVTAIVGSPDVAHDVVQDGFAHALERRAQFRGGSLEAWIWTSVARKALDDRRRRRVHEPIEVTLDPAHVVSERDPELAAAVRALPGRRRLVVFLRYFADLAYAEIASLLDVSEGTVAATLAQAHAELRSTLELEGVQS